MYYRFLGTYIHYKKHKYDSSSVYFHSLYYKFSTIINENPFRSTILPSVSILELFKVTVTFCLPLLAGITDGDTVNPFGAVIFISLFESKRIWHCTSC